jgi:hypothetical protein
VLFDANIDKLIQLYIIGVFTSFTLSQAGMVVHWKRELATTADRAQRRRMRGSQAINAVGTVLTALVLVVVFATKIVHGAWLAVAAMVVLFFLMRGINRYYGRVEAEVASTDWSPTLPPRVHAVVLISRLHKPALRALAFAKATRADRLEAVTVDVDEADTRRLLREWDSRDIQTPLVVLSSPYRDVSRPIIDHVKRLRGLDPHGVVSVFIPEYVVPRWWQNLLHNQSAFRLKYRLLFTRGVVVINVPYHIGRTDMGWLTSDRRDTDRPQEDTGRSPRSRHATPPRS